MRTSQVALLSAVGAVALGMLIIVAAMRFGVRDIEPGQTAGFGSGPRDLGDTITRTLPIRDFRGLVLRGPWVVEVEQGEQWRVQVSYPENGDEELEIEVRDGQLYLDWSEPRNSRWTWFGGPDPLRVAVVMPDLDRIEIAGTSQFEFRGFDGEGLELEIAGAANVEGHDSRYDRLDLSVSGAGRVAMEDVLVTDANVDLAGASTVELTMNGGILSGVLSGAGNVRYNGTVSEQRVDVSGFGRVFRVD